MHTYMHIYKVVGDAVESAMDGIDTIVRHASTVFKHTNLLMVCVCVCLYVPVCSA